MKQARIVIVAAFVIFGAGAAQAQTTGGYPSRPVRIVVPFAAGGNVDLVARAVAQRLTESLGQQVLVDNRPGASGLVGTQLVAKSAPGGYTLLAMANTFAVVPSLMAHPGYDPLKDFAAISLTCRVPQVLVVNPALPVRSVKEFVALAKSRPGEISYASAGTGGTGHMAAELFNSHAGLKMLHVPYKGNAQAIVDVISGQVTMMFDQVSTSAPHIQAGKLRALAVTSLKRSPLFPNLPTIDESGVRGFEDIKRARRAGGNTPGNPDPSQCRGCKSRAFSGAAQAFSGTRRRIDGERVAGRLCRVHQGRIRQEGQARTRDRPQDRVIG
jgi:tripartite-type tricarboxylate transporter receptor subunit TctC